MTAAIRWEMLTSANTRKIGPYWLVHGISNLHGVTGLFLLFLG